MERKQHGPQLIQSLPTLQEKLVLRRGMDVWVYCVIKSALGVQHNRTRVDRLSEASADLVC